ncbi:MAG: radical SAM protein, partial [bacterium]|nr:radical SAM protein [bacterium]
HLPVQSGDNSVLKRMNRHYTRERYIELVKQIREARPDIALGTDIIVGFCGETEENFANTVDMYKQCDFDIAFLAQYSERSGTTSAKNFVDDVSVINKKARWTILQNLMEEIVERKNEKYSGQKISVLVDKCENGVCSGNSFDMKLVQFLGDASMIGRIVEVEVAEPEMWRLKAKISQ